MSFNIHGAEPVCGAGDWSEYWVTPKRGSLGGSLEGKNHHPCRRSPAFNY